VNFADAYVDARAYQQGFNVYERAISLAELNGLRDKQADALRKYLKAAEQARRQTNNRFERDRYNSTVSVVCNRLRRITDADRPRWAMPECGGGPLQ
jgi:hypothetical protein